MESLTILEQIEKYDKLMKKQTEEYKNAMEFYNGLDVSSHKLLAELALTYTVCMAYISICSNIVKLSIFIPPQSYIITHQICFDNIYFIIKISHMI